MSSPSRSVAVFGGSDPPPGDPIYEMARRVGSLLAGQGIELLNGGYGGVMEATSRGAREAGGRVVGITTDDFAGSGNRYLTEEIREPDLLLRTRTLLRRPGAFVVLPGRAGTLAELTLLWALQRAGLLGERPVVLLGPEWPGVVEALENSGVLEGSHREVTRFASSPDEAVSLVLLGLESFERYGRSKE